MKAVSYSDLLKMFWKNHDPTIKCKNQYMSAIFYHDEEQKALAMETMKEACKSQNRSITTKILPFGKFYNAEG